MNFRNQIRQILADKGWTGADLARAVGVSIPTVVRWVRGAYGAPKAGAARQALVDLGVELDEPLPPAWAIEIEIKRRARGWTARHTGEMIGVSTLSYIERGIYRLPDVVAAELLRDLLGLGSIPPYHDKRREARAQARIMFDLALETQARDIEGRDVWGDQVRLERIKRQWSRSRLARAAGLPTSTIISVEVSTDEPSRPSRYRAASFLELALGRPLVKPWCDLCRHERLKCVRLRRGWSIRSLADRAGVSTSIVVDIERGDRRKRDDLFRFCLRALEVSETDLRAAAPPPLIRET